VTEGDIPHEVKTFLREHINSLVQLEVLLLLHGNPTGAWDVDKVNRELQLGTELIRKQLADLHGHGLLDLAEGADEAYRYNPVTSELDQAVNALAKCYKERRVSVTSFIYSSPLDSIRNFADAFRIRKDE
jgi:hypothetical protein